MELHIAVVDDQKSDRTVLENGLREFFADFPDVHPVIECYCRAESLLLKFTESRYQLVFLDICMDSMNGIELAKRLREEDSKLLIVFLTSSREYAFDAFPVHPFDYLMKPCSTENLSRVLSEAMRVLRSGDPEITVRVSRAVYQVPLRKISSVESQGHIVEIHLTTGEILRSIMTFSEVSKCLADDKRFLLCNRGLLVNMDRVLSLNGETLKMKDGTVYPLRVRDRVMIVSQFSQYMLSRLERGMEF